jgi:transposase
MSTDFRFFGGIDWASETHQVCLVAADGKIVGERAFAHGGAGLAEMCDWLVTTSGEVPHGPVVEILLDRRFQVDAVNPKQLDRFRDRFTVAGAKDDRRDAYVLADALRTDRHCFRRLAIEDPVVIELREWSRMAEDLQQERNRLANRVREQLWRHYPQALELGDDLAADWFLDLWAVFAREKGPMGLVIRTIGMARARVKIGLANLTYNMKRAAPFATQHRAGPR